MLHPKNLVIYADKGIVVLNKPNGLPAQSHQPLESSARGGDPFATVLRNVQNALSIQDDLRPVHRLDKPTTGVLVLARSARMAQELSAQIARRKTVKKTYLALVCGSASDFPAVKGSIKTFLECINGQVNVQGTANPLPPRGDEYGENWIKHGVTEYEVLASSPKVPLSLVRLNLITGCKHQIRVQLAQLFGTPVLSDSLYGSVEKDEPLKTLLGSRYTPCLYLHSSRFSFIRYRPRGYKKEFRFTVGAPLNPAFLDVCNAAHIPIGLDALKGGVWVDETKVRGPGAVKERTIHPDKDAANGEEASLMDTIAELDGVWYGPTR
ncbi:pseudouridine synthase [Trametes punicea]|nr:pseudouridine synthase [Trametes punicea]